MKNNKNVYLAKIKDSFIFDRNSRRSHWYFVYLDKNKQVKYLKELTHLYKPDRVRFHQLNNGRLKKIKIDIFDTASGVYKNKICRNINGTRFTRNDIRINSDYRRFKFKILNKKTS